MPTTHSSDTTAPTPRRTPEAYLRAEISAFPLVGEEAFRRSLIELDPKIKVDSVTPQGTPTYQLWRSCETLLAPHTGWSLDRLIAARDRAWFDSEHPDKPVPLHRYLKRLARAHLVARAGVTEIEQSTELAAWDAAAHYHWLTITLPEDILLTALGVEPAPVRVDIDPPLLVRRLLDDGVAEIHQHIGAGMNFPLLWVSALAAIANSYIQEDQLASPNAPFDNGKNLIRWLLAAAIARCALAEHLIRGEDDFKAFLAEQFLAGRRHPAPCQCSACLTFDDSRLTWSERQKDILRKTLKALAMGDAELLPDIELLRDLYADIHPTALTFGDKPIKSVEDAFQRCDPIAVRLNLHGENVGERWLMRQGLAYLNAGSDGYDQYFARIFWQTIRIRCQYYRAVVQRPLTGGLQWFIRFYARLSDLRNPINPILLEMAYHVAGTGHRIRAIEFRNSIASTAIKIGEEVLGHLKSWRRVLEHRNLSATDPEMGIVFHFVKDRDDNKNWERGIPAAFWANTYAEPHKADADNSDDDGRYVSYYVKNSAKACALAELIEAVPSCLWVIRGLDVATDELGIPTWVLAPLFRHVLDTAATASAMPNKGSYQHHPPPLRVTAHVGEDFRHLLEGLRRIYEQVHYILGNTPGRLGHAVALGVDPPTWAESAGSILMPAEERLWDLVWEWRMYTHYRIKPGFAASAPAGRIETVINQIHALSELVYKTPRYTVEQLAEAHHLLHRFLVPPFTPAPAVEGHFDTFRHWADNIRTWSDHEGRQVHAPDQVSNILQAYLDKEACFQRGQSLIDIPIRGDEIAALQAIQFALRSGIAQSGIVVEVNPSSNLLIGDLLDLRNHPILRLRPPVPEPDAPPPVAIAVGSDDPLTFSTQLLREYTLLHQAACAAGYPEKAVYEWLESIRHTSMDSRFTRAWRPNALKKVNDLIEDLSEYLQLPD
ncbi:hypothetical protein KFZ76_21250 [Methylovulum psychrotolerans]|uniref:hypothetical protein n=1 Tax=Methylovulum psychrotolerans TaxID=1704499 RepID=UPI001BFF11BC|nr:hypothetical protein [Methylovulum psychrotolerans]MBT9100233.1 hypothetical protein [Methylovulum psychrotolerans]